MRRPAAFICLLVLAMASWCVSASSLRVNAYADALYARNSIVPFEHPIATLVCKALAANLEVILVVGHADASEDSPQKLSERRTEAVKQRLVELGIPPSRIYVESVGARRPIARDEPDMNRRVEVEMSGTPAGHQANCPESGLNSITSLPLSAALVVAHAKVRDRLVPAHAPAVGAIAAKRMDLLDRLLTGPDRIALTAEGRFALMRAAMGGGDPVYVRRVIASGVKIGEFQNRALPVIWAVCRWGQVAADENQQLQLLDEVIAWGAQVNGASENRSYESSALRCAAAGNLLRVADRLLRAGAKPDLPLSQPPVLAATQHPEMMRKLVGAGADFRVKEQNKFSLFHIFHFSRAADVDWMAALGLDINAMDVNNETPLMRALYYASPEVLDRFVANGAVLPADMDVLAKRAAGNPPARDWLAIQSRRASGAVEKRS